MAIARGSIRHSLGEDLWSFASMLLRPRTCSARATAEDKDLLVTMVRERFRVSRAVAFPYARTGVYAALASLRLPRGSEVLLTPITIGPMLEVILALGLRPVFVDIELRTFGPDPVDLADKLARCPSAFLLTYLFGYVPNVASILSACASCGTRVIEDVSHNVGGSFDGQPLGTFGIAGVHSASLLKYVDGYNGAFVMTSDSAFADSLGAIAGGLQAPSYRRIRGCVQRTLIWNLALNRWMFSLATYPALACLKRASPLGFEKILGPSLFLDTDSLTLPNHYFEDIAAIQCRTIVKHLARLDALIDSRREAARLAELAWQDVAGRPSAADLVDRGGEQAAHTFWQFVVPVNDVAAARDALFKKGVETGTTNLMDLALASGIRLPNAQALKERHIFIPLHQHLTRRDYAKMFVALRAAGQIGK